MGFSNGGVIRRQPAKPGRSRHQSAFPLAGIGVTMPLKMLPSTHHDNSVVG
jgi:hypothetical protein